MVHGFADGLVAAGQQLPCIHVEDGLEGRHLIEIHQFPLFRVGEQGDAVGMVHQAGHAVRLEVGQDRDDDGLIGIDGKVGEAPAGAVAGAEADLVALLEPGLFEDDMETGDVGRHLGIGEGFAADGVEGRLVPVLARRVLQALEIVRIIAHISKFKYTSARRPRKISNNLSYFLPLRRKIRPMRRKPIIALIYDFDGTLSPGNMQEFGFIQAIHQTPEEFWTKSDGIARGQDASNILAYMKLMYDEAKKNGIKLTRSDFHRYGADIKLFDGVRDWFRNINEYGAARGVKIEHYINSSGLKEIIEGSPIAREFKHIFAGSFIYDENGEAEWPGIAVDFTAKTQFLFKIQKGIFSSRDARRVNESMADENKRIPFSNMIYFGDGETDVPSMKVVNMFGGNAIAVFNPAIPAKRAAAQKLLRQGRANFITPANYSRDSRTFRIVTTIIDKIKVENELKLLSRYK